MFANILKTDFVQNLEKKAIDGPIKKDRERYINLYKCIEIYIYDNDLILSDINILKNNEKEPYKDHYEIYCSSSFRHANNLVNILATLLKKENKNYKTLLLRTSIAHTQLDILYEQRSLVQINELLANKIHKKSIINPIKKKAFYSNNMINMMPYEIELINIYKQLYSPEYNERWENLVKLESIFFTKSLNYVDIIEKVGGKQINNINIISLRKIFLLNSLPNEEYVLIGSWAKTLIEYGKNGINWDSKDKLQIISPNSMYDTFEFIKKEINKIIPESPFNLQYKEQKLYLPNEHRLQKFTIKILLPCQQEGKCPVFLKTLMDVYTNAQYELIPWVLSDKFSKNKNLNFPKNIKIGNPYVLLRFIFIDIWTLKLLYIKELFPKHIITNKIKNLILLASNIRDSQKMGGIIDETFSVINYLGSYYNDFIYFKNKIQGEKHPFYYPYQWNKKNKKYREI